jgi:hypothetical protein
MPETTREEQFEERFGSCAHCGWISRRFAHCGRERDSGIKPFRSALDRETPGGRAQEEETKR